MLIKIVIDKKKLIKKNFNNILGILYLLNYDICNYW